MLNKTIILSTAILALSFSFAQFSDNKRKDYNYDSILIENFNNVEELEEGAGIELMLQFSCDFDCKDVKVDDDAPIDYYQNLIKGLRNKNKETISLFKKTQLRALNLEKYGFKISDYAPFALKRYESLEEYQNDKRVIYSLLKSNKIVKGYASNEMVAGHLQQETTILNSSSPVNMTLSEAKSMIGVTSPLYTGSGIKVGIIDEGYVDDTTNFPIGSIVASHAGLPKSHTTVVASIIGGATGIAPDCEMYISGCFPSYPNNDIYSFFDCIEWLVDNGVNVINMSMKNFEYGYYDGFCAYVDYIAHTQKITIVKSSGNQSITKLISNPGLALNAITVGSVDGNGDVSSFSSYTYDNIYNGIVAKPTLVAPGENISIPNITNSVSGTSASTPMVTGCVALLMEQKPLLLWRPDLAMSLLINSTNYLPTQINVWDECCGAGLLNYQNASALLTNTYIANSVYTWAPSNYLVGTANYVIPSRTHADVAFVHLYNSNVTSPYYGQINSINLTKYRIVVADLSSNILAEYTGNSNTAIISAYNSDYNSKQVIVSVYLNGSKVESGTEYFSITFSVHDHVYERQHLYYNQQYHKDYCVCGEYTFGVHVVSQGSTYYYNGHLYGDCVLCNRAIDLTNNNVIIEGFDNLVTDNGSYVLPNGVIVLVDDDLEAYYNGSLYFYPSNCNTM